MSDAEALFTALCSGLERAGRERGYTIEGMTVLAGDHFVPDPSKEPLHFDRFVNYEEIETLGRLESHVAGLESALREFAATSCAHFYGPAEVHKTFEQAAAACKFCRARAALKWDEAS